LIQCAASEDTDRTGQPEARDSVEIVLVAHDSLSAYELLAESHQVSAKETAMGIFVSGIDSVTNFTGGYWLYSVNDTSPKIAADKLITNHGDTVKWHFRLMGQ
jgi:hypothetical protein